MKEELKKLGLTDKEIEVYLAALKLGGSAVARIVEVSGISRSTVYDILHSLIDKGLVSTYQKDKKQHFDATPPRVFLDEIKNKEKLLKELIPKLDAFAGTFVEKPSIEVYEKVMGIQSLLDEIYEEKEILLYGSAKKAVAALKHLPESLARKRVENKIRLRAIFEHSKEATFRMTDPKIKPFTKMRFLNVLGELPSVTFIAGNKMAIITLEKELIGIKIEDPSIIKTQRALFEILWNVAKPK